MLTLRRASTNSIKAHGLRIGALQSCGTLESASSYVEEKLGSSEHPSCMIDKWSPSKRFYHTFQIPRQFLLGSRGFSLQVGARSGGEDEDDLEDEFSELGEPESSETVSHLDEDNEFVPEPELSDDEGDDSKQASDNELVLDAEVDGTETLPQRKRFPSAIFRAIMDEPTQSVYDVLDKYVANGNEVSHSEVSFAVSDLCRRHMFSKALQLSEWLETNKVLDFGQQDYASRVSLIAKVHGLQKAENYIDNIPESCRGEMVYGTLLANCVSANDVKKAEEVFNKMKDLEFSLTSFSCDPLLFLYKRNDKRKIANVLLFMEKENIKPSALTYRILIDAKGQSKDLDGIDRIVKTMKTKGVELDIQTQAILARHYAAGGLKEKAKAALREVEGTDLKLKRRLCHLLLPLYAVLRNADEVGRLWEFCKSKPTLQECLAAIEAFGKLKKIYEAEAVFNKTVKTWKNCSPKPYYALLLVYRSHKMLSKGKDLVKRMADSGCKVGPLTLDALVNLYVGAGEVEKADKILQKAAEKYKSKPLFSSYLALLDQYAGRGDVHNSEKMFHKMKQAGYDTRARVFQSLLRAYVNAKAPAYGIRERMKADNILFPGGALAELLVLVNAFRETPGSDLFD